MECYIFLDAEDPRALIVRGITPFRNSRSQMSSVRTMHCALPQCVSTGCGQKSNLPAPNGHSPFAKYTGHSLGQLTATQCWKALPRAGGSLVSGNKKNNSPWKAPKCLLRARASKTSSWPQHSAIVLCQCSFTASWALGLPSGPGAVAVVV